MELKITPSGQTIVKPTALGPVANTDTKLLIYGLFQKGRVFAQDGKIERWHKTIKSDALRPASPTSLEEARRLMERFVEYYNGSRLHSAIGYIAPLDFMDGKATQIWSERDRKLEQARKLRRERRANKVPA